MKNDDQDHSLSERIGIVLMKKESGGNRYRRKCRLRSGKEGPEVAPKLKSEQPGWYKNKGIKAKKEGDSKNVGR